MTYLEWEKIVESNFPQNMLADIEQFLANDGNRPNGLDLYDDCFSTNLFFPLQRQREMRKMIQVAREIQPRVIVEVGADKGGGVYHWCKCFPGLERMIACEVRGLPYSKLFEDVFDDVQFLWLPQSSHDIETFHAISEYLGKREADVLFIDGDKLGFLADFETGKLLVREGGIIFMHDIQDDFPGGPRSAFEEVKRQGYRTAEIIDVEDSREALKREQAGIPSSCPHESWLRHWAGRSCGVGVIYLDGKKR